MLQNMFHLGSSKGSNGSKGSKGSKVYVFATP